MVKTANKMNTNLEFTLSLKLQALMEPLLKKECKCLNKHIRLVAKL